MAVPVNRAIDAGADGDLAPHLLVLRVHAAFSESRFAIALILPVVVVAVVLLWTKVEHWRLVTWSGGLAAAYGARLLLYAAYVRSTAGRSPAGEQRWADTQTVALAVAGLAWSALYWLVAVHADADGGLVSAAVLMAVAGVALGGLSTLPVGYAAFTSTMLLPPALMLAGTGGWANVALAVTLVLYVLTMSLLAVRTCRQFERHALLDMARLRAEARFRDIAVASGDWFWEGDAEGRLTCISDSVERITGTPPAWFIGRRPQDMIVANKLVLESVSMDLRALVEHVRVLLEPACAAKGVAFECVIAPALPALVQGDPMRVRQVLINLAGNAVKFTTQGRVRVAVGGARAGDDAATVHFDIIDTGRGIAAAVQAVLFAPFTQADASISREYGGTGLGLAISRQLVQAMGGRIGLESSSGQGSRFWFALPMPAAGPSDRAAKPDPAKPDAPLPALRSQVESDAAVVEVAVFDPAALARLRAYQVAGEEDMVAGVLKRFLGGADVQIKSMRSAMVRDDFSAAGAAAHGMKSSAAFAGVPRLSAACAQLDIAGRGDSATAAKHAFAQVQREYAAAVPLLQAALSDALLVSGAGSPQPVPTVSPTTHTRSGPP